jgi:hypothetical protein
VVGVPDVAVITNAGQALLVTVNVISIASDKLFDKYPVWVTV